MESRIYVIVLWVKIVLIFNSHCLYNSSYDMWSWIAQNVAKFENFMESIPPDSVDYFTWANLFLFFALLAVWFPT